MLDELRRQIDSPLAGIGVMQSSLNRLQYHLGSWSVLEFMRTVLRVYDCVLSNKSARDNLPTQMMKVLESQYAECFSSYFSAKGKSP